MTKSLTEIGIDLIKAAENQPSANGHVGQLGQLVTGKPQIVVLDRGFIYVGEARVEGDAIIIEKAQNVRRWGTKRGLGQLAAEGPQAQTVLDPAGLVRAPLASVVHLIDCKADVWTL